MGQVVEITGDHLGIVELQGSHSRVDLSLLDGVAPGEWVIVHAGFAIERLDEAEAEARLALFEEMAEAYREHTSRDPDPEEPGP